MPESHAYLFEAVSVQRYILDGGRLRAMVGASDLIERLTCDDGLLDETLGVLGLGEAVRFARRAGGAIVAISEDAAALARFADAWPALVVQRAPGLEFVQARAEGPSEAEAIGNLRLRAGGNRSRVPLQLPLAGPLAQRDARVGEAAAVERRFAGRREPTAASIVAKLAELHRGETLVRRLAPDIAVARWPRDLQGEPGSESPFPFHGERRVVGIVHADGNRLGVLLRVLHGAARHAPQGYAALQRAFSDRLRRATEQAARTAVHEVLLDGLADDAMIPARPIVLGGDDLSIIVRADLALPFARRFLEAFQAATREQLGALAEGNPALAPLAEGLTACAGIAYCHASHPFWMAHELAAELCDHAKEVARAGLDDAQATPGALSFHRVTTALSTDYGTVLNEELRLPAEHGAPLQTTLECYGLDSGGALPPLDGLLALQRLLQSEPFARGPFRQLLTLGGSSETALRARYARVRAVMSDQRAPQSRRDAWAAWEQGLRRLLEATGRTPEPDLPFAAGDDVRPGPLADLASLIAVGNRVS